MEIKAIKKKQTCWKHYLLKNIIVCALLAIQGFATKAFCLHFEVDGFWYTTCSGGVELSMYNYYNDNQLSHINIPSQVEYEGVTYKVVSIGNIESDYIQSVTIPNTVSTIKYHAFFGCENLTRLDIPASVTNMKEAPFSECPKLATITVDKNNPVFDSRDNCNAIIQTANNRLIAGCKSTKIPNTVTTIGIGAFCNIVGLETIEIPSSVTSIEAGAFAECEDLKGIFIPKSVLSLGAYPDGYWEDDDDDDDNDVFVPVTAARTALPEEGKAKPKTTLRQMLRKEGYQSDDDFFTPFDGCLNLSAISVEAGNPNYDSRNNCNAIIETATNKLLTGCNTTVIPATVTEIGSGSFCALENLTKIDIPNSVVRIAQFAFSESGLEEVTLPPSLEYIGEHAFFATKLREVVIPNSVEQIEYKTFSYCESLASVTIPNSVTSIGSDAFCGCSGLAAINIPQYVTSIESGTFRGCKSLSSVIIPESVTSIGSAAFFECSGLTSINIPNSVTSIGAGAFYKCI